MRRITEQCDKYGIFRSLPIKENNLGDKKDTVLNYMSNRKFAIEASTAIIHDFIADIDNPDYCCIRYANAKYEWTSNDIYYIEKYNMEISKDFVSSIMNKAV